MVHLNYYDHALYLMEGYMIIVIYIKHYFVQSGVKSRSILCESEL